MSDSKEKCLLCGAPASIGKVFETTEFQLFAKPGQAVEIEYFLCDACNEERESQRHAEALLMAKAHFLNSTYCPIPNGVLIH